jgi:anaerobic magnesium-protoporphyrin IX monomethyl ester cyclase
MASRTCPFQCDFCPQAVFFTNPQHQSRSADNVIQEILTLVERYGVKEVEFYDPTFGARREEALSICQKLIDAGKPVTWSCLSRGDLLDAELTDAMAEAGCHRVLVGVESGDDAILEATGKNESLSQIRRGIGNCHRNGLDVIATFIVGLPGETPESVAKTARLARELKPTYAIFSLARMTPFSIDNPRWTEAGRITDEYSVIEGSFYGPAYVPNGFKSHRELRFHQRKAYVAFYGRPSYLVNRLMDIKTVDDARRFMNGGLTVLKQLGAGTHHLTIDSS